MLLNIIGELMKIPDLVYEVLTYIPKGKVLTYGCISKLTGINPRQVGAILHQNPNPDRFPCHRIVNFAGNLAKSYAFGGSAVQYSKLAQEGVNFNDFKVNIEDCLWQPNKLMLEYFALKSFFGDPGPWPWFNQDTPHTPEEIAIGAILTQNTNWQNVQKSIESLRTNNLITLKSIYSSSDEKIKDCIRSSGYYNQKSIYLKNLAQEIVENHSSLRALQKLSLLDLRKYLLSIKGIGKETADTIMLYALNQPVFVIDSYTKKFLGHLCLEKIGDYDEMQIYFCSQLPRDVKLFQDYHALIVQWAKTTKEK
jgi:endonuclease-3 related protein